MPTHKGIKLSVVSQWELRVHPEFPHPESSQFTYRSPRLNNSATLSDLTPPSSSSDSKADRLLGRQSSVSVYIPSISGARFWIRYDVKNAFAVETPWFYFKLFMNGRHIASWGTNTKRRPSGQIMKAIFEPGDRWVIKKDHIVYKREGMEERPFFFNVEAEGASLAEDGGLIEVRVFRARGRQRRLAYPEAFKSQDQYGIVMPSGGLVDHPEDARMYDWHLKDPKDNPFATFKFYYRTWNSLTSLEIIPVDHPRRLLQPSPSILSLNGQSRQLQKQLEEECPADKSKEENLKVPADEVKLHSPRSEKRESGSSDNSTTPWITGVFDDSPESAAKNLRKGSLFVPMLNAGGSTSKPLSKIPTSKFFEAGILREKYMAEQNWGPDFFNRPLPEIPIQSTSSVHSRNASTGSATSSGAISITPSLRQWVESDAISSDDEIGTATLVTIPRISWGTDMDSEAGKGEAKGLEKGNSKEPNTKDSPKAKEAFDTKEPSSDKSSNLEPPSAIASKRRGMASPPPRDFFSNVTLRKKKSPFKSVSKLITSSPDTGKNEDAEKEYEDLDLTTTISPTESEWMVKTPSLSPHRNSEETAQVRKFRSPGLERSKGGGSLRKRAMDWYDNTARRSSDSPSGGSLDGDMKAKGNWI